MKPEEIKAGRIYRNKGRGLTARKVLQIEKGLPCVWLGSGDPPDEPVVVYRSTSLSGTPWGMGRSMYLGSFAKWAGSELTPTDTKTE